jgi:hypothetical protein
LLPVVHILFECNAVLDVVITMIDFAREKDEIRDLLFAPDIEGAPPLVTLCRLNPETDEPGWEPIELVTEFLAVAREEGFADELVNCGDPNLLTPLHWAAVHNFHGMSCLYVMERVCARQCSNTHSVSLSLSLCVCVCVW